MYSLKTTPDAAPQMADTLAYLEERLQRSNAALETALEAAPDAYCAADEESMEDVQKLLALAIRLYVSNYHAGREMPFFGPGHGVCATDVMIASTEMLKVVNVQLFELGMFQTWSKH
ncbi:MAG TPA: hypothetical protein VGM52_15125 [Herbaspirillum sp.]|jgi:hypothetical protein